MNERRFVAERSARWRDLETLIDRAHRAGLRNLPGPDVRRLGSLYRDAATDLAAARTLRFSEDTLRHVNRLCAAAHDLVYASRRRGPAGVFVGTLAHGFPALVRRTALWHVAAAAILAGAGIASFLVFRADPDLVDRTMGTVLRARADRALAAPADSRRYLDVSLSFAPFLSWGIIANNITASLLIFSLCAVTVAVGVVSLLANGVMMGGVTAVFVDAGIPGVLGEFVCGHAPVELTAIFLAGGAGLRVGVSWMMPGRRSRLAAFQETGRDALVILMGTTLMLVVAGLIEGFVSPSMLPWPVKAGAGIVSFAAWAGWVLAGGRGEAAAARPTA